MIMVGWSYRDWQEASVSRDNQETLSLNGCATKSHGLSILPSPAGRGAGGEGELRASATVAAVRNALTLTLSLWERGFIKNRKTLSKTAMSKRRRDNGPADPAAHQVTHPKAAASPSLPRSRVGHHFGGEPLQPLQRLRQV